MTIKLLFNIDIAAYIRNMLKISALQCCSESNSYYTSVGVCLKTDLGETHSRMTCMQPGARSSFLKRRTTTSTSSITPPLSWALHRFQFTLN